MTPAAHGTDPIALMRLLHLPHSVTQLSQILCCNTQGVGACHFATKICHFTTGRVFVACDTSRITKRSRGGEAAAACLGPVGRPRPVQGTTRPSRAVR